MARARSSRTSWRWSSACQSASFRPNVIGSAWTPCVRPIIAACLWRKARSRSAAIKSTSSARSRSMASRISIESAVSTTSDEVSP